MVESANVIGTRSVSAFSVAMRKANRLDVLKSIFLELYLGYPLDVNRTFAAPDYPIGTASEKQRSSYETIVQGMIMDPTQNLGSRRLVELRRNDPAGGRFARCFTSLRNDDDAAGRAWNVGYERSLLYSHRNDGRTAAATRPASLCCSTARSPAADFALLLLRHLHGRTRQMARRIGLERACQIGRRIAVVRRA